MDEIVKNLSRFRTKNVMSIKESLAQHKISEADDEDISTEEETLDTEEEIDAGNASAEMEDNSTEEDIGADTVDDTESDDSIESGDTGTHDNEYVDPDGDTEAENAEDGDLEDNDHEYVNPLDNPHAVKHTIGEEVLLAYSNGTNSKLKGEIDGYDKEGFYRILWSNGLTTDGITDAALSSFVDSQKESKCVCGNTEFVTEGKNVICDNCGRKIREAKQDPLSIADKKRPAGKRMIRSEAHPMSTSISETIKNAFKKKSINENKVPDIFDKLTANLGGEFWTRKEEMKDDIEDLGFLVEEINDEYIIVSGDDYETELTHAVLIPIVGTSRTMTLDFDRMRSV